MRDLLSPVLPIGQGLEYQSMIRLSHGSLLGRRSGEAGRLDEWDALTLFLPRWREVPTPQGMKEWQADRVTLQPVLNP